MTYNLVFVDDLPPADLLADFVWDHGSRRDLEKTIVKWICVNVGRTGVPEGGASWDIWDMRHGFLRNENTKSNFASV
jgi:hypothetical protein